MLRTVGVVTALQLIAWSPAWACTGQVGASIFQDTFADDSGGWDENPPSSVVTPPSFVFTLNAQIDAQASQNLTFNATDGDYCMDFILPPAISATNQIYAGIEFWATDYDNFMETEVSSAGTVDLAKVVAGKWTYVFTVPNTPGFQSGANAVNSLRVTAMAGTVTVYLNGTQVKSVRAQESTNPALNFGMVISDDTAVANAPAVLVKGYSVTAGK
jgi:hypothetical protein